jgi:hypothetical protein
MLKAIASLSFRILCAIALFAATGTASATWESLQAKVTRVLVTSNDRFGGCMAALSVNPQTKMASCGAWWVTFSCSGHFTDKVRAYRMLDQAQLALATGKNVAVVFRDDKKHNGYCYANRIDVIR